MQQDSRKSPFGIGIQDTDRLLIPHREDLRGEPYPSHGPAHQHPSHRPELPQSQETRAEKLEKDD